MKPRSVLASALFAFAAATTPYSASADPVAGAAIGAGAGALVGHAVSGRDGALVGQTIV